MRPAYHFHTIVHFSTLRAFSVWYLFNDLTYVTGGNGIVLFVTWTRTGCEPTQVNVWICVEQHPKVFFDCHFCMIRPTRCHSSRFACERWKRGLYSYIVFNLSPWLQTSDTPHLLFSMRIDTIGYNCCVPYSFAISFQVKSITHSRWKKMEFYVCGRKDKMDLLNSVLSVLFATSPFILICPFTISILWFHLMFCSWFQLRLFQSRKSIKKTKTTATFKEEA